MRDKYLIIGSGPAGLKAAEKIREINGAKEVKLVSKEDCMPYCPAALPYLLAGRMKEDDMWLRDEGHFRRKDITFVRGKKIVQLVPDKKQVIYQDGDIDEYETLLIATGAQTSLPPVEGISGVNVLGFRTIGDCKELNGKLNRNTHVTILGAGMVAVELAMALIERGNKVQILGRGRPLRSYFDEESGAYVRAVMVDHGVQIATGKKIKRVQEQGDTIEVVCADGDVVETNLLICCAGVEPRIPFLDGTGVQVNQGIVVDNRLRTNIQGIYAAGDVAETPDFFNREYGINAILPNALDQGGIAGINMTGREERYKGWIPMNVVNLVGSIFFSIGFSGMRKGKGITIKEEKQEEKRYFKRLVFEAGRLVGGMFVNTDVDPGIIRYLIEHRIDVGDYIEPLFYETRDLSRWLMLEAERHTLR
jgi:phenylglyoxylate dehydrogenase epsilon subunit